MGRYTAMAFGAMFIVGGVDLGFVALLGVIYLVRRPGGTDDYSPVISSPLATT